VVGENIWKWRKVACRISKGTGQFNDGLLTLGLTVEVTHH
jgi:hypothetical protein